MRQNLQLVVSTMTQNKNNTVINVTLSLTEKMRHTRPTGFPLEKENTQIKRKKYDCLSITNLLYIA